MRGSPTRPTAWIHRFICGVLLSLLPLAATALGTGSASAARRDVFAPPGFVFEEDCCLQVAVFLAHFAAQHPSEKARLVRVSVPGHKSHALAAFTEAGTVRFWDQTLGVLSGAGEVVDLESGACERAAQARFDAKLRRLGEHARFPAPAFPAPRRTADELGYLEKIRDSLPCALQAEVFSASDAAGRSRYVLGFHAGAFWGVYAAGIGTVLTRLDRLAPVPEETGERKLIFVMRVTREVFHKSFLVARLQPEAEPLEACPASPAPAYG